MNHFAIASLLTPEYGSLSCAHWIAREQVSRPPKLNLEQLRALREQLRRRQFLLQELAILNVKTLAHRHGVSRDTIRRMDWALHGVHTPDPVMRFVTQNEAA